MSVDFPPAILSFGLEFVAGMPQIRLTDFARLRLEVMSFFLVALLLLAWIFQLLWNAISKDIPSWPKLHFRGAAGILVVTLLLLGLVLSMITGARELMTPRAWKPKGSTFVLQEHHAGQSKEWLDSACQQRIQNLRDALWEYAANHDRNLPPHRLTDGVPLQTWLTIDPGGARFDYWAGARADEGDRLVVVEPAVFGEERFVLWSSGVISKIPEKEAAEHLARMLREKE